MQYILNVIYTYQSVCIMILCGHGRDRKLCIHNSSKRFPDDHFALASCPHVVLLINFCKFWPLQKAPTIHACSRKAPGAFMSRSYSYLFLPISIWWFAIWELRFCHDCGDHIWPKGGSSTRAWLFRILKTKQKYLTDQVAPLEVYCRILRSENSPNRKSPCAPPHICLSGSDLSKEPPRQDSWCFCAIERRRFVGQSATLQKIHMEHNNFLEVWFRSNFPFLNHGWWL